MLGRDPLSIELIWRQLYEVSAHIVGKGAELRGLSAIDVPLWDIFGQATNMPIWQLLGGAARDRIKTYNTLWWAALWPRYPGAQWLYRLS